MRVGEFGGAPAVAALRGRAAAGRPVKTRVFRRSVSVSARGAARNDALLSGSQLSDAAGDGAAPDRAAAAAGAGVGASAGAGSDRQCYLR